MGHQRWLGAAGIGQDAGRQILLIEGQGFLVKGLGKIISVMIAIVSVQQVMKLVFECRLLFDYVPPLV